jgi:hypothetical protein
MINKVYRLVTLVVRGGVEPPTFRFQAHTPRRCMWLDVA